jgi:hypothetical protein
MTLCRRCDGFGKTLSQLDCWRCGGSGIEHPPLTWLVIGLRLCAVGFLAVALYYLCVNP